MNKPPKRGTRIPLHIAADGTPNPPYTLYLTPATVTALLAHLAQTEAGARWVLQALGRINAGAHDVAAVQRALEG